MIFLSLDEAAAVLDGDTFPGHFGVTVNPDDARPGRDRAGRLIGPAVADGITDALCDAGFRVLVSYDWKAAGRPIKSFEVTRAPRRGR